MVDRHLLIRILGTTALTSLWPWLMVPPACANPQGATVVGGSALVVTTSPTVLNVDQASQNAVINWRSFSVGAGEQTNFHQPSASSLTVNRVTGVDPSTIAGQITANGRIVLTNPNGVVVSQGARVNAGSFIATTSGITNSNAMAGNLDFTVGSSSPTASVVNRGRITVRQGGLAALVAPGVENDGVILARLGKVALASGQTFTLDLEGDRLVNFAVGGQVLNRVTAPDGTPLSAAVTNAGKIIARGGLVAISVDAAEGVVNQAINMTGIVQATSAHEVAGTIVLNGGAGGVVNLTGTLDASGNGAGESGGRITVRAGGGVMQTGTITASGAVDGGRVRLAAPEIINQGQISADAQSGNGGGIAIHARSAYIDTESSTLSAQSFGAGSGGSISVTAATTGATLGSIFVSGTHSVRSAGGLGGSIAESAGTVDLVGATIDASGATGGGSIEVGGGPHGAGALADSTATLVTPGSVLDADARGSGTGGNVVVWSNATTTFAGAITAQGGPAAGNGGMVEVSSKGDLVYAGTADVAAASASGTAGTLLLDPANITIESASAGGGVAQYQLIEPAANVTGSGTFGNQVLALAGGNILVTNPTATVAGIGDAGAVYVYNGTSGQLVSMLTGGTTGDEVGSSGSISILSSGNFVVNTPNYGGGTTPSQALGAVTFGSAATGVAGMISPQISLVGGAAGDQVGSGGIQPVGGNYVVLSPNWGGGLGSQLGAVTWGSAATGISGAVSATNSLVGDASGDQVGSGAFDVLGNGNVLVFSPNYGSGGVPTQARGAVTFVDGTNGVTGTLSTTNSLIGQNAGDQVGSGGYVGLNGGNSDFVIYSPNYGGNGGSNLPLGAVTFGSGTSGFPGTPGAVAVSATNSLVGSNPGDDVGSGGIYPLVNNDAYVVVSPNYSSVSASLVGAVTWGDGSTGGVFGPIASTASLFGSNDDDQIGSGGVVALTDGDFFVLSPNWSNDGAPGTGIGAITMGSGTTGFGGGEIVGYNNSLTGDNYGDELGASIQVNGQATSPIVPLLGSAAGNYLIDDPTYQELSDPGGAVIFVAAGTTPTGDVGSQNALFGTGAGDQVGSGGIVPLNNGNFLVLSPNYGSQNSLSPVGAVTWGSGTAGFGGGPLFVDASNSLVGSVNGDQVGSGGIRVLASSNYLVLSPNWGGGSSLSNLGAVTFGSGASGVSGVVGPDNSLVGSASGDQVGSGDVQFVGSGNYVVVSPNWSGNPTVSQLGAVTFGNGISGVIGPVGPGNSLVGSVSNDNVGGNGVDVLPNGNYVVLSPNWSGSTGFSQLGAVTFGSGTSGVIGAVSASNSLVGSTSGDQVGTGLSVLGNSTNASNYVVLSPYWNGNEGAATWSNGNSGPTIGAVTSSNSLVGSNPGDYVGIDGVSTVGSAGGYLVYSPYWAGPSGLSNLGAVSWGNGNAAGATGVVSASNSLVGSSTGDEVGSDFIQGLSNGNYLIRSPNWGGTPGLTGLGAVTFAMGNAAAPTGAVSAANSLVGAATNDAVGSGGIVDLTYLMGQPSPFLNAFYLVLSPGVNGGAGAITLGNGATGVSGIVSADNSLIGSAPGAGLAYRYFDATNDVVVATENEGSGGQVALGLFDPNLLTFGRATGQDVALSADSLSAALAIENVTLQATNDITVASNLTVTTGGYALELDAGGSITIEPNVVLALDGSFTAIANDTAANPQTGTGGITVMPGAVIDPAQPPPTGAISLTVDLGGTPGPIDLASGSVVNGGTGTVTISAAGTLVADGTVMGSAVLAQATGPVTLGGVITASDTGNSLTLVTGGAFTNTSGAGALATPNGNWLLYSQNPAADTIDGLPFAFKQYDAPYNTAPAVANADGLLYALAPIVSLTGVSKVYDGTTTATLANNDTLTGVQSGDTVTLGASSGSYATQNAGSGIDVSFTNLAITSAMDRSAMVYGYTLAPLAQPNAIGTITPAPLTVTAVTNTKTYDGTTSAAAVPTVSGTLYDSATFAESYATSNAASGLTLTPSVTITNANDYAVTLVTNVTGVITPEMLTVTAASNTKTYDGTTSAAAVPAITSGTLYNGDTGSFSETYASVNAATGIALTATGAVTDPGNYALSFVANPNGVITPAPLTVTAVTNTKTYDGTTSAAAVPVITTGQLYNGDTGSFSESYASANAATGITLTATGTISDPGNYALSFATNPNGVIDPALLTVTANSASRVYGTANPNLTASVSGLQGSDTTADLGLSVATSAMNPGRFVGPAGLGGVATAGAPVGNYPITAAITDTNYTLNLVPGTLMVTPATLDVVVDDASRLYGAANPLLTGSVIGLIGTDTAASLGLGFATTAIGGTPNAAGSNVGAYPITAAIASANYTLSTMPGVLAVDPAPLLVAVGNATRYVGQANPPFVSLVAGLAGTDTAASIGLSFATSAIGGAGGVGGSPAGLYPITASFASGDYIETLIPGSLRILPAPANGIANVSFVIPQSFNIFQRTPQFFYLDSEVALSAIPPVPNGDQFATTSLHLTLVGTGSYEYLTNYFAPIDRGLLLPISP